MKNPKTLKELEADHRVEHVMIDDLGRWEGKEWFVRLAKGYIADDETTTVVGDRVDVLRRMRDVIAGEPV